jgi:SAM-dependent methyltransferase
MVIFRQMRSLKRKYRSQKTIAMGKSARRRCASFFRVVKPGGKIVIVDYALPRWWHPLRYLWRPILARLEPFALDLWREDIRKWSPMSGVGRSRSRRFFGGLYQILVLTLVVPIHMRLSASSTKG